MRTLVTGATGFIGLEVTRQLSAAGARPRVLVRRPSRAALLSGLDVETVEGDLGSATSLRRAVDGVDAVIHLAARATMEPYPYVRPTLVDGTDRLVRAAVAAGVGHVTFGSSVLVHDEADGPVRDDTPARSRLGYGRAKIEAERLLASSGVPAACVRLPHVYGPHSLLFGMVRRRVVPFPGSGRARFGQLHVEDAARVLVAASSQRWTGCAAVADRWSPTWDEFFAVLAGAAPLTRVVRVPPAVGWAGTRVAGPLLSRVGPTIVSPDTVRSWNVDLPVETSSLWSALGLAPHHPTVRDGIPAVLDGSVAFRWRHPLFDRSLS